MRFVLSIDFFLAYDIFLRLSTALHREDRFHKINLLSQHYSFSTFPDFLLSSSLLAQVVYFLPSVNSFTLSFRCQALIAFLVSCFFLLRLLLFIAFIYELAINFSRFF